MTVCIQLESTFEPSYNLECQHVRMYLRMQYGPEVFFKHGYCEMQHTAKKMDKNLHVFKKQE